MTLKWDDEQCLLTADSMKEALSVTHYSGRRQVGVWQDDALYVFDIGMDGVVLTHAPDHWGVPAWSWYPKEG